MSCLAPIALPLAAQVDTTFPSIGNSGDAQHDDRCAPIG